MRDFPMLRRFALVMAVLVAAVPRLAIADTIRPLAHPAPDGALVTFQLTDGTVLAQGFGQSDWWKLTPDDKGSYVNGTWTSISSLPNDYAPLYFASAVLADGRFVISG